MIHIVLHFALCAAMSGAPPQAMFPVHVVATDRSNAKDVDQTFQVERGYDDQKTVEFDMDRGTYLLQVTARPKADCSGSQFIQVLPEQNRSVTMVMQQGKPPLGQPLLVSGKAPQSFLFAKPTYVLLPPSTACSATIPSSLAGSIDVDNQQDGYYAQIQSDAATVPKAILAMRIKNAASQYHYVKITIPYPPGWSGWPSTIHFDVTEDMIDELAGMPVNQLLCLKLWKTSSG